MSDYLELKPIVDFIDINIALAKKQVEEDKTLDDFWQGYYTAKEETYRAMKAFLETEPKSDVAPVRHAVKAESTISKTGLMCTACYSDADVDAVYCKYCGALMDGKEE